MECRFGGKLEIGDFIAVSNGNHIDFGWYVGNGRGTLQYYNIRTLTYVYEKYLNWKSNNLSENNYYKSIFEKNGFTIKCLWKSYINSVHKTRVIKITNIEDIFTDKEDREDYKKSREALINLGIIKN